MALHPRNNVIRYRPRFGLAHVARNNIGEMIRAAGHQEEADPACDFDDVERTVVELCRPEQHIAAVWIDKTTSRFESFYVFTTAPRVAPVLRWFDLHFAHSLLTSQPIFIENVSEKNTLLRDFYGSPIRKCSTGWVTLNGGRYHGDVGLMMGRGLWVDVIAIPRLNVDWSLLSSTSDLNKNGKRVLRSHLPRFPSNRRPPARLFPYQEFTVSVSKPSRNNESCQLQYYTEFGSIRFAGPFVVLSCRRDKLSRAATIRADLRQMFISADHPIAAWCRRMPDATYPDHPMLPPVAHWSLERFELVEDLVSGLQGRVSHVQEKGQIAFDVTTLDGVSHHLEVPWRQVRKVFSVGDFVSVSSPLREPKTAWVIAAGTEDEIRDDVASIVERQKRRVAERPEEFKPEYIWTEEQQKKVIRYRQRYLQVMTHHRNFHGIVSNEFLFVEKNACVKVEPDLYIQSTYSEQESLHKPPSTPSENDTCLGTRLQIRYLKARAEDASSGLRYPNPDKGPVPPSVVLRGFPAFVVEKGYFTGREPWVGRAVIIQGGEFKGRKGHVCGVSVHNWNIKAGVELNRNDTALVLADQKSMKRNESGLWVHITLYEGGRSTKHDVTVKYDHVIDAESSAPLRIVRPLTSRQVKAGYVGNRSFYLEEVTRMFMIGRRAFFHSTVGDTPSVKPLRRQDPMAPTLPPPTAIQHAESPPADPWYAKDFLVGWDLRTMDSNSKAQRPAPIAVRVLRSSSDTIEMFKVGGNGTVLPTPLDGNRYRPLHPGKKPNIKSRWVCFRGQHEGTFVRGIRIQHRASTPFEEFDANDMDWYCFAVTPRRGAKDIETNFELWPHDEDLVVMADDGETMKANEEYSQRKEGSRDGGRGMFCDGGRRF
ncbi:hypothetical protein BDZ89DRAFT_1141417 [Hymenopellis radicata]|nr:hypothetical protein BDZ89DRAFT_1141417 [Hymenopellis radicata]